MVRGAAFAHAGEAEAIELTLASIPKDPSRPVLDAGCGLGGTADYVQRGGWGRVTGFDIDAVSIAKAQESFPECSFAACDVARAGSHWPEAFDLIYSFNACYAFPDQAEALRQLALCAKSGATLLIFDYTDPENNFQEADFYKRETATTWKPLHPPAFEQWTIAAGWESVSYIDLTGEYIRWYADFVSRIALRRPEILTLQPPEIYEFVLSFYSNLLESLRAGQMGGGLFRLQKTS